MMRLFGSPSRYIQGPGVLGQIGAIASAIGTRACVIIDDGVREVAGEPIERSLAKAGVAALVLPFGGEITYGRIEALAQRGQAGSPALVIACGGGKALDAGKGVGTRLRVPTVTVPTIASNDAPTSATYAIYDDTHTMIATDRMISSPHTVLVDTWLIANAPAKFLRWGIGDALTKTFEAEGCWAGRGQTPFGTRPLRIGRVIAEAGYRTLRTHAAAALAAVTRKEVTQDVEATVEACILMSGLGFENGGLSLAHSMTRGLVKARDAMNAPHGEQVAYGVLVQLAIENRADAEILDLIGFNREIGLPVRLAELGMADPSNAEIDEIARLAMTAPHIPNLAIEIDRTDIAAAMHRIERLTADIA